MGEWRMGEWEEWSLVHHSPVPRTGDECVGAVKGCLVAVHVRLAGAGQDCGTVGPQMARPAHLQGCGRSGCRMTLRHLTQAGTAAAAAGHHLDCHWCRSCVVSSPSPGPPVQASFCENCPGLYMCAA